MIPRLLFPLLLLAALAGPARAGAPVELRVWAMGLEGELLPGFAREFERENPDVRVRVQAMSWGGVQEKMIAAALSGRPPDVAQMGTTMMTKFACMGVLEPLSGPLSRAGIRPDGFFAGSRATAAFDGELFGAPWYVDTRIMLYRREALERAGLSRPPETWEEFLDFGRRIMARRKDGLPTVFCDLGGDPLTWFYWQAGGEYNVDDPARPCVAREPFLAAADHLLAFYREGLVPVESPSSGLDYLEEFVRGHYVATFTGPWMVCDLDRKFPDDRARRVAAPFPRKANRASFVGGSNLVVFRAAREKEAALRYVAWASRPDVQARWYARSRCLPAAREAWSLPELSPEVDPSRRPSAPRSRRPVSRPRRPNGRSREPSRGAFMSG